MAQKRHKIYPYIYYPISNKYTKWYINIISKAQMRSVDLRIRSKENLRNRKRFNPGQFEEHHIIPKSLGGLHQSDNWTFLTPKEHMICHHLLCYMFQHGSKQHDKMWYAYRRMLYRHDCVGIPIKPREYQLAKTVCAKIASVNRTGKPGTPHTASHKEHMRQLATGRKRTAEQIEHHRRLIIGKPCHPNTRLAASRNWTIVEPCGRTYDIKGLKTWCRVTPNVNWNGVQTYLRKGLPDYKGYIIRKSSEP